MTRGRRDKKTVIPLSELFARFGGPEGFLSLGRKNLVEGRELEELEKVVRIELERSQRKKAKEGG